MTYFIIENEIEFLKSMYKNNPSSPFICKEGPESEIYSTITAWCNVNWLLKDNPVHGKYIKDGKSPIFVIDDENSLGITNNGILYIISEDCFLYTSDRFRIFRRSFVDLIPGLCKNTNR